MVKIRWALYGWASSILVPQSDSNRITVVSWMSPQFRPHQTSSFTTTAVVGIVSSFTDSHQTGPNDKLHLAHASYLTIRIN